MIAYVEVSPQTIYISEICMIKRFCKWVGLQAEVYETWRLGYTYAAW